MERFLVEIRVVEVDFFKDVGLMFKLHTVWYRNSNFII